MNALVVEDDKVIRMVLARLLAKSAYEVSACASGEEAREYYHLVFYPLIFLDLFLTGMDGFTSVRAGDFSLLKDGYSI